MTEYGPRTGAARDVPPPRPLAAPAPEVVETGLGRAARALADAVAGLMGSAPSSSDAPGRAGDGGPRSAAAGVRDVVGAVAGAVASAFGRAPESGTPSAPPDGERSPGALLGDLLAAAAPRLPIRDAARLRAAHPGASDDEIADALVARAARLTAGIGAATGGLSAMLWLAPATLLTLPLDLGA